MITLSSKLTEDGEFGYGRVGEVDVGGYTGHDRTQQSRDEGFHISLQTVTRSDEPLPSGGRALLLFIAAEETTKRKTPWSSVYSS